MLLDVEAITGLRPTSESFNPTDSKENSIGFDKDITGFTKYMEHYHDKDVDYVLDQEHIAFLALWLSKFVFCYRSLKVDKRFIALAHQLHQVRNTCLRKLILGSLYESLGEGVYLMMTLKPSTNYLIASPFWLLQLWLNATFAQALMLDLPEEKTPQLINELLKVLVSYKWHQMMLIWIKNLVWLNT